MGGGSKPTILVPLDVSDLSERALSLAVHAARGLSSRLLLISAPQISGLDVALYGDMSVPVPEVQPFVPVESLLERARDDAAEYLAKTAMSLHDDGVEVETIVEDGEPAEMILKAVSERRVSLIVMATHGRGGLRRWAFGSIADKVMRRTETPLLLVRSTTDHVIARPRHILVPLDGSEQAENVLEFAGSLAKGYDSRMTLVHVVPDFGHIGWAAPPDPPEIERGYRRWLEGYMESPLQRLRSAGLTASFEELSGDSVAETLLERQARGDVDLVALSTHGRGGAARFALGSVADRIIRGGTTPVLVVRRHG